MTQKINHGGLAFPCPGNPDSMPKESGMTMREYFAAHAPPMSEQWAEELIGDGHHCFDAEAAWRWTYADAMIKAGG